MFSTSTISNSSAKVESAKWAPSAWRRHFTQATKVTAEDLENYRAAIGNAKYPETVLWLARTGKLRPKVLADAAYTAWLKTENPKKVMCASDWTELFRMAYMPSHELFETPDTA